MDKNQYPKGLINNNYSPAVVTLNPPASPSPRPGAGRVGGIRKSPLIEISRYSQRLLKSPDSKELLIINSKMDIKAPQALLRAQGEGMGASPQALRGGEEVKLGEKLIGLLFFIYKYVNDISTS